VKGEELEQLKGVLSDRSEKFTTNIKLGDEVTLLSAPFEGSEGFVIDINEAKGTLKININLLGRDTPVEIEFGNVKVKK
jgi:transcriptional antiterminator NusG